MIDESSFSNNIGNKKNMNKYFNNMETSYIDIHNLKSF